MRIGSKVFETSDYAAESANPFPEHFTQAILAQPDELFMDLGCGYRGDVVYDNCLYVEVYPSRSADLVVEPTCRYPIVDGSLQGIGCFAVLEHTRQPWVVVEEMRRMLKPGGRVFIDWPFLQPVHGYPSHFFNATREGLTSIFEDAGFAVDVATTGHHQTVAYTVRWILGALNARLPVELRPELATMTIGDIIALDVQGEQWWRWINALDDAAKAELACGNILVATAP